MSYNNIFNPLTNEFVELNTSEGISLLKKYVSYVQNGGVKKSKKVQNLNLKDPRNSNLNLNQNLPPRRQKQKQQRKKQQRKKQRKKQQQHKQKQHKQQQHKQKQHKQQKSSTSSRKSISNSRSIRKRKKICN